ncbi:hypothetical protein HMN09_00844900 [Mycena chlorophos]|uniref:Uncharacterized protein n=1 Tax=Mycena chlorophos TaxID=658473 RepID=A0A8H6W4B0_MYCCL|nr:hypothetical protein HMN09_00844900 [Mycena chlorophos]
MKIFRSRVASLPQTTMSDDDADFKPDRSSSLEPLPSRSPTSGRAPRASAGLTRERFRPYFADGGSLDSQTDSQQYIENLINNASEERKEGTETQLQTELDNDLLDLEESQIRDPELSYADAWAELVMRRSETAWLRMRLGAMAGELEAVTLERDQLGDACADLSAENHDLRRGDYGHAASSKELGVLLREKKQWVRERAELVERYDEAVAMVKKWRQAAEPLINLASQPT